MLHKYIEGMVEGIEKLGAAIDLNQTLSIYYMNMLRFFLISLLAKTVANQGKEITITNIIS